MDRHIDTHGAQGKELECSGSVVVVLPACSCSWNERRSKTESNVGCCEKRTKQNYAKHTRTAMKTKRKRTTFTILRQAVKRTVLATLLLTLTSTSTWRRRSCVYRKCRWQRTVVENLRAAHMICIKYKELKLYKTIKQFLLAD